MDSLLREEIAEAFDRVRERDSGIVQLMGVDGNEGQSGSGTVVSSSWWVLTEMKDSVREWDCGVVQLMGVDGNEGQCQRVGLWNRPAYGC